MTGDSRKYGSSLSRSASVGEGSGTDVVVNGETMTSLRAKYNDEPSQGQEPRRTLERRYYLDCEFDGYQGALISLALVGDDNRSVSYVIQDYADDPWVQENVIPHLWKANASTRLWTLEGAAMDIADFLRDSGGAVIVADWPADIRYFCDLIEFPGGNMAPIAGLRFEVVRVDAYPTPLPGAIQHNAWWDAMALKHLLSKLPSDGSSQKPHPHEAPITEEMVERRERGWLIERNGEWYAAAPHSEWTLKQAVDGGLWRENWTRDANKALRFARKVDAETLIQFEGLQNTFATEHEFGLTLPRRPITPSMIDRAGDVIQARAGRILDGETIREALEAALGSDEPYLRKHGEE